MGVCAIGVTGADRKRFLIPSTDGRAVLGWIISTGLRMIGAPVCGRA